MRVQMEKEDIYRLPEIYLSPSRLSRSQGASSSRQQGAGGAGVSVSNGNTSSDTDQNVWGDTDEDIFVPLVAESTIQEDSGVEDRSVSEPEPLAQNSNLGAPLVPQSKTANDSLNSTNNVLVLRGKTPGSRQRGETPGSDSPPVAGAIAISSTLTDVGAALPVAFRPQILETNISLRSQSELVLSPDENEGYRQPSGVHAYYSSDSDIEDSNWNIFQEVVTSLGQVPVRDEVEGADSVTPTPRLSYLSKTTPVAPERMERNSSAGFSTPDGEIDRQPNIPSNNNRGIKIKSSIRPPVVGQSKENFGQPIRKDLGSTDGEESEDEVPIKESSPIRDHIEIVESQLTSIGSQSENTDSLSTVLDLGMSRGEIQGCETGDGDSAGTKTDFSVIGMKPTFLVGGLMNPSGRFRNNIQGRMQDVKASLQNQTIVTRSTSIEREQFISQPPLYPFVSEQEMSLASILSVESTNHPDSSERVTSPSVVSVSSATSSRRLEWDSGADVGYTGGNPPKEKLATSLSTLERIAIGNYASVLRTEPEGTTQIKEKKPNRKGSKLSSRTSETNRSSTKVSASSSSNSTSYASKKINNFDDKASLPSLSWRYQQHRYKNNHVSSSDEECHAKAATSPVASPRRKPRKKNDSPSKRNYLKGKQPTAGPLRELARELNNEGKSSSLVDLHPILESFQIRRSSSQQDLVQRDLSFSSLNSESSSIKIISSALTGTGSSTSVATTVYKRTLGKTLRHVDSAISSSSTLVQTDSLLSVSRNSSNEKTLEKTYEKKYSDKASNLKSSYYTDGIPKILKQPNRRSFSSINEQSSPSYETSDVDTPSDMKETDGEFFLSSSQISEDESFIRKNKNYLNDKRSQNKMYSLSGKAWESIDNSEKTIDDVSHKHSTSAHSSAVEDGNKDLQTLSVRLQNRVQSLMEVSSVQKAHDYKKLQDYIEFIGHPSANEEELNLKHNVAGVIMRMFGEIGMEESDSSSGGTMATTIHSETSESLTTIGSSTRSRQENNGAGKFVASKQSQIIQEDLAAERNKQIKSPPKIDPSMSVSPCSLCSDDMEEMMERVITPGGTANLVPYRPPSSTKMYYINIAQESGESGVEGGRTTSSLSKPSINSMERNNCAQESSCSTWRNLSQDNEVSIRATATSILLPPNRVILNDTDEEMISASGGAGEHVRLENCDTPTSEDLSPRLKTITSFPSWQSEPSVPSVNESLGAWQQQQQQQHGPTKKFEGLYQDCLGTLHIAHQPPGYAEDQDSPHSSEFMSEHEYQHNVEDAEGSQRCRVSRAAWSSSVSESAYETIRERDRHVDEALASSFEFYPTSPRDARCRGYVSSEEERDQGGDNSSLAPVSELFTASATAAAVATASSTSNASSQDQHKSVSGRHLNRSNSSLSGSASTNRSASTNKRAGSQQYYQYHQNQRAEGSSHGSSSTEGDRSSHVEFIKAQKAKHMIKIQQHIHTLEKLERDLINELGENVGSSPHIHRHVTEGRSSTEPDTKKPRGARKILRQSGTAASSVISTDLSNGVNSRYPSQRHEDGKENRKIGRKERYEDGKENRKIGRKDPGPSMRPERQLPKAKLILKKGNARPISTDSQRSSPRLSGAVSRMSSEHRSSDYISPEISLVENEVKHLLAMEKWTNQEVRVSEDFVLSKEYPRRPDPSVQESPIRTMRREEPRGEEDPRRIQKTQRKIFTNMLPVSKSSEKTIEKSNGRPLGKSSEVIPQGDMYKSIKTRGNNVRDLSATPHLSSGTPQLSSATPHLSSATPHLSSATPHLSRRGDGREERDGVFKVIPVVQSDNSVNSTKSLTVPKSGCFRKGSSQKIDARKGSSDKVKALNDGNIRSSEKHKNITLKDFSQMYPSFESVVDIDSDSDNIDTINKLSVGIQTSASLLCLSEINDKFTTIKPDTITQGIQTTLPFTKNHNLLTHTQPSSSNTKLKETQSQEILISSIHNNKEDNECIDSMNSNLHANHKNLRDIRSQHRYQDSQHDIPAITNEVYVNLSESENIVSRNQSPSNFQNMNCISSQQSEQVIKENTLKENAQQRLSQNENDSNHTYQEFESHRSFGQDAKIIQKSKQSNITHQNIVRHEKHKNNQHTIELADIIPEVSHRSEYVSTEENEKQISDSQFQKKVSCSTVYYEVPSIRQAHGNQISHQSNSAREVQVSSARQLNTRPNSARDDRFNFSQQKHHNSGLNQCHNVPESSQFNLARHSQGHSKRAMITDHSKRNKKDLIKNAEHLSLEEYRESENELIRAKYKKPEQFNVSATKISINENELCSSTDEKEKGISLQDALLSAHPGYLHSAENRRLQIRMKAALRKQAQEHNHQVLAQVPSNLQTPSTIKRFLYKPEVKPLFTYKDIRVQNARLYQLLPEAQAPIIQGKRGAVYRTNRLMANMYSQRLSKKVLAGKTNHAHLDVITPIATRRR